MKRGKKGRYVRMESRHRIRKKAISKTTAENASTQKENKNENTILALLRCRFSIYFESKHSF